MRGTFTVLLVASGLVIGCAGNPDRHTLAELRDVEPEMTEVRVENSLEQAILGYGKFLEEAPESELTPEAMRRLADLKLEKEFGILGDDGIVELPAAEESAAPAKGPRSEPAPATASVGESESEEDFERRASGPQRIAGSKEALPSDHPGSSAAAAAGPREAIELYDRILTAYPDYPLADQVLYQKSRAYDELAETEKAMEVMKRLVAEYPNSKFIDEVQFRRAEHFFVRKQYLDAEDAYLSITDGGPSSEFYELALYKLGWTFYKQELYEEALDKYITLLDYKVSIGYDFERPNDEDEERRIADTYRVISLCFSSLGGPDVVEQYFAENGQRSYEEHIYAHLGNFYLDKLRYNDAAASYGAFVGLYPLHRAAPHFGMRIIEIYEAGGFPKLVLESKKEFAARYGLESEYWQSFDVEDSPDVLGYLRTNLEDLASHYHAAYQEATSPDQKTGSFDEALRWYRAYLASFPAEETTPPIHYRLADLLLENRDFAEAAREYERTAYDYPMHEQASAAGYAAVYARREHLKLATGADQESARREAVSTTLRFVDAFPAHEHAAASLSAALEDLYEMNEFEQALDNGRRLIAAYPDADLPILRSAWAVVAHSSFDLGDYAASEEAYVRVLEMTPESDDARQAVVDNLAASIYKQGEAANAAGEFRLAADHFLRVARAAPTSEIRALAEYDAGAALMRLEDWSEAAAVLESFREAHPDHDLNKEATKQIASIYRQDGKAERAAAEYERVAAEAEDTELRREALLEAGELYESEKVVDRALAVYLRYVKEFAHPLEPAVETRFKIAEMFEGAGDEAGYRDQLQQIVEIDRSAEDERTPRIRYLAARSSLVLTEDLYRQFDEVELSQPLERNLQEKQRRMDAALDGFGKLVDYEVAEVTAAATFYIAEVYSEFSKALVTSERPGGLDVADMQEYETALEEEAFPFEEKAIEIHEKNLELMAGGIYNAWIDKSLARLADLVPGRYAKFEASSGLIASIDSYAYEVPSTPAGAPPEGQIAAPDAEAPAEPADGTESAPPEGQIAAPDSEAPTEAADGAESAPSEGQIAAPDSEAPAEAAEEIEPGGTEPSVPAAADETQTIEEPSDADPE